MLFACMFIESEKSLMSAVYFYTENVKMQNFAKEFPFEIKTLGICLIQYQS